MVDRGNTNKHRYSYSGGVKAVEESKWGADAARRRYGELKYEHGAPPPKDQSRTQNPGDRQARSNDVPEGSWLRGGTGKK